ncbi:MAG: NADAR family protein [Cytophagaceae bacterium]
MKYDIQWLLGKKEKGENPKFLFFWGHQPAKNGQLSATCFSQWWISPFEHEGINYNTAEHWMMAEKARLFGDQEILDKIVKAESAPEAKKLGRMIRDFKEDKWLEKRYGIVLQGSLHKFGQHQNLKEYLLNTSDRIIVEASPVDRIWGIGLTADSAKASDPAQWNGLNLLGFALMEVRDILRNKN